jgi:hypothetical protein
LWRNFSVGGGQKADKTMVLSAFSAKEKEVSCTNAGSAKPLCVGSIPTRASKSLLPVVKGYRISE